MSVEPLWSLTTPEDKEGIAKGVSVYNPRGALNWYALASLQRDGRLKDYRAAVRAWEDAKPNPEDFATSGERERLAQLERELREKAKAEFDTLWGKGA